MEKDCTGWFDSIYPELKEEEFENPFIYATLIVIIIFIALVFVYRCKLS